MARIVGIDLPKEKRVEIGLTHIYGVGQTTANKILKIANVEPGKRVKDLSGEEVSRLSSAVGGFKIEGDLRRDISQNIKRMIEIGSYRGLRHRRSLPVRGQRTHTNARTVKGPRRTTAGIKRK